LLRSSSLAAFTVFGATKPPNAVDRLLHAIWQVRSARRSENLRELCDSELLMYMADLMSDAPADHRPNYILSGGG
jgi:hypothetical protein